MATLSLAQLCRVVTPQGARDLLTDILVSLKFPARSWQEGSNQRSLLEAYSYTYASCTEVIAKMAASGFNDTAEDEWLDLFSMSEYRHKRKDAVRTRGYAQLVASAAAPGPFVMDDRSVVLSDATGRTYRNVEPFTLSAGQTVSVLFEAETAGAAGDVATGALTELKTPLAGVSASNPPLPGATTWITVNGADRESDVALRERNANKWGTLGAVAMPRRAYAYYALKASDSVRRVYIDDQNPRGPGTISIFVAGDAGPVAAPVVTLVNEFLSGSSDGVEKRAAGADVVAYSAAAQSVPVAGAVYLMSAYNTTQTRADIEAALKTYFRDLPVGGQRVTAHAPGVVGFGELYRAILTIPGVRNVAFTTPLADVPMAPSAVATPALALTYESI
jgi:uncharacterized phage protein gp47/JayE